MAKVHSEAHCASSTAGVQVEGGIALTCPNVQEFRHSRGNTGHVGHPGRSAPGSRTSAAPNQTGP